MASSLPVHLIMLVATNATSDLLDLFKSGTYYLAAAIEAGAGLIIGLAAVQGVVQFVRIFIRHNSDQQAKEDIRLGLGRWLALALEFELAADILRTAVAPTWDEIGQLAAIIVIRTVLNYFLQQDIDKAAAQRDQSNARQHDPASDLAAHERGNLCGCTTLAFGPRSLNSLAH